MSSTQHPPLLQLGPSTELLEVPLGLCGEWLVWRSPDRERNRTVPPGEDGDPTSEPAVRAAVKSGHHFNVIHMNAAVKVDPFLAGNDPFDLERLDRRQALQLPTEPEIRVYVDTAEHSVLRKLEWFRRGGEVSERQWRDVVAILRIQGARLDQSRLSMWAPRLGVADLLDRATQEAAGSE